MATATRKTSHFNEYTNGWTNKRTSKRASHWACASTVEKSVRTKWPKLAGWTRCKKRKNHSHTHNQRALSLHVLKRWQLMLHVFQYVCFKLDFLILAFLPSMRSEFSRFCRISVRFVSFLFVAHSLLIFLGSSHLIPILLYSLTQHFGCAHIIECAGHNSQRTPSTTTPRINRKQEKKKHTRKKDIS